MHFDSKYYCRIKNFEGILRILEDLYVFSTAWYLLHEDFIVPGIRFGIAELTEAEKKALDLSYHFRILRMSTFQEMIQFFNNTHVRNAIHENVCVIFYGTDLKYYFDNLNLE